jgi:tRNA modification GTPase
MNPDSTDTIAAIATPPGQGGIGVVRVSGPDVPGIARRLFGGLPAERRAEVHPFRTADGDIIDVGLVLYFAAPASFTGEHVLELQGHGGPVVLELLLARVLELGARPARPGEFSERAFLNRKLDLAQAEAIADLIESSTASAARAAMQSLQGVFSARIHALTEMLTDLRMVVEAAIDFPEEEIDFLSDRQCRDDLNRIQQELATVLLTAQQGCLLRDGLRLVIAGHPNAGKSSLLNRLAGRDAAIVTDVPGTTRDVVREQIQIDGMPLQILDTAGLRASADRVEQEGIRRTRAEIEQADHVLYLVDDQLADRLPGTGDLPEGIAFTLVYNKIDLSGRAPGLVKNADPPAIGLSAKTGQGLDELKAHLKQCAGFSETAEGGFSARRRHLDNLQRAQSHLETGARQLDQARAGELLAEELRLAQNALGEITGEVTSDDLLGKIFSSFCIGK